MRKSVLGLVLLAVTVFIGAEVTHAQNQSFTGEIMDGACAGMGSHAMMLKEHGMAGKENELAAKKMCTMDCVKNGSKFVLFDAGTKNVYQLDDQKKPADFAGQNVTVTGTLNKGTKTIHVTGIKAKA
jgi:hypothetical protein